MCYCCLLLLLSLIALESVRTNYPDALESTIIRSVQFSLRLIQKLYIFFSDRVVIIGVFFYMFLGGCHFHAFQIVRSFG